VDALVEAALVAEFLGQPVGADEDTQALVPRQTQAIDGAQLATQSQQALDGIGGVDVGDVAQQGSLLADLPCCTLA